MRQSVTLEEAAGHPETLLWMHCLQLGRQYFTFTYCHHSHVAEHPLHHPNLSELTVTDCDSTNMLSASPPFASIITTTS